MINKIKGGFKYFLFPIAFIFSMSSSCAEVISLHFDDADIFVVRRSDIWSPDVNELTTSIKPISRKKFRFMFTDDDGTVYLGSTFNGGKIPQNPIATLAVPELKNLNVEFEEGDDAPYELLGKRVLIKGEKFQALIQTQNTFFRESIIKSGDPEKLPAKVAKQQFAGDLLGLFSAVFLTKTLGLETGGNFAIGSGVMNDVASLPRSVQAFVLPLSMQGIETDENQSYKTIEFRRVGPNGRVFAYGQILIAYKTERTPDLARKMLVKALPTALGIDTTIEAVEQARKTDFENRKAIWAACVAAGDPRCKPN